MIASVSISIPAAPDGAAADYSGTDAINQAAPGLGGLLALVGLSYDHLKESF